MTSDRAREIQSLMARSMSLPISEPRCSNDDCLIASMCKRNQEMQDILELDGVTVEHFDGPSSGHQCEMFLITDVAREELIEAYSGLGKEVFQ